MWSFLRDTAYRGDKITNAIGQISRQIEAMRGLGWSLAGFHPFKIYPTSDYWPNSASADASAGSNPNWWRTFRIRNGLVLTSTVYGLTVSGTDQTDLPYDEVFLYKKDATTYISTVQEYTVNDNTPMFLFWIEIYTDMSSVSHAVIRYGKDPTDPPAASYTDPDGINPSWTSTNPWTGYPAPDSNHFVLGTVDTMSQHSTLTAVVRQFQTTDIMSGGGTGTTCPYGALIGFITLVGAIFSMIA